MAVRFGANDQFLLRDGSYLDINAAWTISGWASQGTSTPGSGKFRTYYNWGDGAGVDSYIFLGSDADSNNIRLAYFNTAGSVYVQTTAVFTPPDQAYFYWSIRYDGVNQLDFIINQVIIETLIINLSTITFAIKQDSIGGSWSDFFFGEVAVYQTNWSLTTIADNRTVPTPNTTGGFDLSFTVLTSQEDINDITGNGHDWTLTGTLLFPTPCTGIAPVPDNTCTLTAVPHPELPFGRNGAWTTPGNWAVGYCYLTSTVPIDNDPNHQFLISQRTQTVQFATFTITLADCGSIGNSCAVDLAGSIPGNVDPFIIGCNVMLIDVDLGVEWVWFGIEGFDDISIPLACDGNTYPLGQPSGSWSRPVFATRPFGYTLPSNPIQTTNTTKRPGNIEPPLPPPPPPVNFSGIYYINRGKINDTYWTSLIDSTTIDVKIPDPMIRTALLGDE